MTIKPKRYISPTDSNILLHSERHRLRGKSLHGEFILHPATTAEQAAAILLILNCSTLSSRAKGLDVTVYANPEFIKALSEKSSPKNIGGL